MSKLAAIVAAVVVMTLAGCSNGPEPDPGQTPEFTGQPTESTSASPTPSTKPAADCLDGEYRLDRFVAVNDQASFGTGEGGDVRMGFDDKTYTLTGAGQDPITLTLAGQQGTLLVDGSIDGTYALKGNQGDVQGRQGEGLRHRRAGRSEGDAHHGPGRQRARPGREGRPGVQRRRA